MDAHAPTVQERSLHSFRGWFLFTKKRKSVLNERTNERKYFVSSLHYISFCLSLIWMTKKERGHLFTREKKMHYEINLRINVQRTICARVSVFSFEVCAISLEFQWDRFQMVNNRVVNVWHFPSFEYSREKNRFDLNLMRIKKLTKELVTKHWNVWAKLMKKHFFFSSLKNASSKSSRKQKNLRAMEPA